MLLFLKLPHGETKAVAISNGEVQNTRKHLSKGSLFGGGFLAFALSLISAPASALLCSTADPTFVPSGTVLNTIPSDTINSNLNSTDTPPFLVGSTSYTLTNAQPFIAARTFLFDASQPQSNAPGSFLAPLAQLRGLTRAQYLDFFALPNTPPAVERNNAVALVVVPAGTKFWSGPTGPITDPATGYSGVMAAACSTMPATPAS
jgi:hypothetical protein